MNVVIAATSRFHYFDLARQLERLGVLKRMYTGYPTWKLHPAPAPVANIYSFPWVHTCYMALQNFCPRPTKISETLDWMDRASFDSYIANTLPKCDVFTAISGCGLRSGKKAKKNGGRYVCDRGSTHILYQDAILKEESTHWGLPFTPTDRRIIDRELQEYDEADLITVPSSYAKKTFIDAGINEKKLAVIPYGVDLHSFKPVSTPEKESFTVAYVGGMNFRKGIQYLFQAFSKINHPRKFLWMIGQVEQEFIHALQQKGIVPREVVFKGHIDHAHLRTHLSQADVLALPSVEDGFGLVMAQALACGCPVIASTHTGAAEIIAHGINGYIVPARDPVALAEAMQRIADSPVKQIMRDEALVSTRNMGGWQKYGDHVLSTYQLLASGN